MKYMDKMKWFHIKVITVTFKVDQTYYSGSSLEVFTVIKLQYFVRMVYIYTVFQK